jgi:hypothetical protein
VSRVVYVRERVERDIQTRLKTITIANGYSTDIVDAVRRRGFPHAIEHTNEIWLQFGAARYEYRSDQLVDESVGAALIYSASAESGAPATEINARRGDIQKALQTNGAHYIPYTLESGSTPEERQIHLAFIEDEHEWTEALSQPLWLGWMVVEVRYSRMTSNPAKWDSGDVVLTE